MRLFLHRRLHVHPHLQLQMIPPPPQRPLPPQLLRRWRWRRLNQRRCWSPSKADRKEERLCKYGPVSYCLLRRGDEKLSLSLVVVVVTVLPETASWRRLFFSAEAAAARTVLEMKTGSIRGVWRRAGDIAEEP